MNKKEIFSLSPVKCQPEEEIYSLTTVQTMLQQHQNHFHRQQHSLTNTIQTLDSKLKKSEQKNKKFKKIIRSLKAQNIKLKQEKTELQFQLRKLKQTPSNEQNLKSQLQSLKDLCRTQDQKIQLAIDNIGTNKAREISREQLTEFSTRIETRRDLDGSITERIKKTMTLRQELELLKSESTEKMRQPPRLNKTQERVLDPTTVSSNQKVPQEKMRLVKQNAYQCHRKKIFGSFHR